MDVEPVIEREQVHLDPDTDPVDAFIGGYKNGWYAHAARVDTLRRAVYSGNHDDMTVRELRVELARAHVRGDA